MLKTLSQNIIDLVFPVYCLSCGKENIYLCSDCLTKLPKLEKQICIVCQKPSAFGKTHPICQTKYAPAGLVCALSYKEKLVKDIIAAFKFSFISQLAEPLSLLLLDKLEKQELTEYFQDFTLIPVPLHKTRQFWRGFNQSELLANNLALKLNLPVNNQMVSRQKKTKPQADLKLEQRQRNVEGVFEIKEKVNGNYILVDDVVTSGSTAFELTRLLKRAGANEVWSLALAHG